MTDFDCARVVELLPWHLHGTLEEHEAAAVAAHLHACADCRRELEETREMERIASLHAPVGLLADYASGIEIAAEDRRALEEHLAACATCSAEIAPALEDGAARPRRPMRVSWRGWRPLAVAASLTAAVAAGALLWTVERPLAPAAATGVAWRELLPASARTRAADGVVSIETGRPATLLLVTDRALGDVEHRVRLTGENGGLLAQIAGLRTDGSGTFALHLPAPAWPPGTATLVLEARDGDSWKPLETYSLRIEAAAAP